MLCSGAVQRREASVQLNLILKTEEKANDEILSVIIVSAEANAE